MGLLKSNPGILCALVLLVSFALTGLGLAQQGCKQVCVDEAVKCLQTGTKCTAYGNQCVQYRNNCTSYNRYGACTRYQQVCSQYKQVCQRQEQACLRQQKVCKKYDTVCPSAKPAGKPGKAFEQLKEIEQGKDSTFDGGPGSTLNRR
jgi:hypothetical protein